VRVIFLDVDGVLNIESRSYKTFMRPRGQHIEEHLVKRLDYIISQTEAKIVVSSSWKTMMEDLKMQMEEAGFSNWDVVIGKTEINSKLRGDQILECVEHLKHIDSYVVLEDEPDIVCGDKCASIPSEKVVRVDKKNGLTDQNVDEAIKILFGETV